ncbi:vacuolar calcium ion transporter-like protein /H(+) exchanger [Lindgomyces ingoldianus]|uniref:Vacuolar calcium ion transporter-like protein /H(+) exchanger n=1 Tax=Lindgomyces ingoldianus TaxID=673940 RepID=A0ACB6QPY2_9PLEO|nr:vacuolar calcium ion transporter-like protein /H(+) exchanger [Lindgomyces ingoldianus]KAF2468623.1 vacuolar calcium ion transporter-like protein /H(+) exchanger [Lindgomyces ingoldianus]
MPAPTNGSAYGETEPLLGQQQPQQQSRWKALPKHIAAVTWATLSSNYANVFLVFVPLGIIAGALHWSPTSVFILNFIAIIPLAALLSFATEELSAKLGDSLGGLLNATFGNAVELIVSIVALREGEIRIVQSSMLGSILSNILLVLGCCFLAGGIRQQESEFNSTVASTMSSLMAVSSASLIIPATLYAALRTSTDEETDKNILLLSHGTSIILLLLYILYLVFQLHTHKNLFKQDQSKKNKRDIEARAQAQAEQQGESSASASTSPTEPAEPEEEVEEEEAGQILSPIAAGIALVLVTILVAVCAEYLVDSIDSIVQTAHISKTFIGLVLLPIVGNAAEHVTAVIVAYKGKMDLAINVAIGSSMQIALFVTPFLVILGWIMDKPMTLHFQSFETVVFFLSVLVVNYLIQDGKSNYLEGAMCLGTYTIIALAFYVYPDDAKGDLSDSFFRNLWGRN